MKLVLKCGRDVIEQRITDEEHAAEVAQQLIDTMSDDARERPWRVSVEPDD